MYEEIVELLQEVRGSDKEPSLVYYHGRNRDGKRVILPGSPVNLEDEWEPETLASGIMESCQEMASFSRRVHVLVVDIRGPKGQTRVKSREIRVESDVSRDVIMASIVETMVTNNALLSDAIGQQVKTTEALTRGIRDSFDTNAKLMGEFRTFMGKVFDSSEKERKEAIADRLRLVEESADKTAMVAVMESEAEHANEKDSLVERLLMNPEKIAALVLLAKKTFPALAGRKDGQ